MGLGTQGVVLVPTNSKGQMDIDSLDWKIRAALDAGCVPFAGGSYGRYDGDGQYRSVA